MKNTEMVENLKEKIRSRKKGKEGKKEWSSS